MANGDKPVGEVLSLSYAGTDGKMHTLLPGEFAAAPGATVFDERMRIIAVVNGREFELRVKSITVSPSGVRAEFDFDALSYLDAALGG